MQKKLLCGFAPILIILVVVVVLGSGIYLLKDSLKTFFVGNTSTGQVAIVLGSPSPQPSPTPTLSTFSMDDWKTYVSNRFSFTFQYPQEIQGAAALQIEEQPASVLLFVPDTEGALLLVRIVPNGDLTTEYDKDKKDIPSLSSLEKTELNGYSGYWATFQSMSFTSEHIYITRNNSLYIIETGNLPSYRQILSTFKFTQ